VSQSYGTIPEFEEAIQQKNPITKIPTGTRYGGHSCVVLTLDFKNFRGPAASLKSAKG
jgi:hypothetical protein